MTGYASLIKLMLFMVAVRLEIELKIKNSFKTVVFLITERVVVL